MLLGDLREGDPVFIDANIFIYHFGGRSAECKLLLQRCARRQLRGHTATFMLIETLHRLMVIEALQKGLVTAKTAVRKLRERPDLVRQLTTYAEDVSRIAQMGLTVHNLTADTIDASVDVRRRLGLLTNDSLVVTLMAERGLTNIATTDQDFVRVPGLKVYSPSDL